MPKEARRLHTKYRRTYIAGNKHPPASASTADDIFPERLDDVLPLPHEKEGAVQAQPTQATHSSSATIDTELEWQCAAAGFKQLAFNYSVLLGKTPQECERDLKTALLKMAVRHPEYHTTEFFKAATK